MSQSNYSTFGKNSKTRPIYLGGKQVAVLRDDKLLDIRKHSDHFFYLKDDEGILQKCVCIATETLRQGRHANIIQVTDIEKQIVYTISRRDFDRRSFDFETSRATGFEEQRGCYLEYFASNEPERVNYPRRIEAEPLPSKRRLKSSDKQKQLTLNGWGM